MRAWHTASQEISCRSRWCFTLQAYLAVASIIAAHGYCVGVHSDCTWHRIAVLLLNTLCFSPVYLSLLLLMMLLADARIVSSGDVS